MKMKIVVTSVCSLTVANVDFLKSYSILLCSFVGFVNNNFKIR
jgi:hypothetical protein